MIGIEFVLVLSFTSKFTLALIILNLIDFLGGTIILKNSDQTKFSLQPFIGRILIFTQSNESQLCNQYYNDELKDGTRYDFHLTFSVQKPAKKISY